MFLIMKNGMKIHVKTKGTGFPIVLLPGNNLSAAYFFRQRKLARRFRLIIIDNIGHGKSQKITSPTTFEQMASVVEEVLNRLGIARCLLAGHSDGANLAMICAGLFPEKIAGLFLNAGNLRFDGLEPAGQKTALMEVGLYRRLSFLGSPMKNRYLISQMMLRDLHIDKRRLLAGRFPVLVIVGGKDTIKKHHSAEIASLFPFSRLMIIPGHGHHMAWTCPKTYNRLLRQMAEKVQAYESGVHKHNIHAKPGKDADRF